MPEDTSPFWELTGEQKEALGRLDESIQRTTKFVFSLRQESQRGSALIAAAFLDKHLFELLRRRMIQDASQGSLNEFFERDGAPLSSFSARIEAAYLLGLIGKKARDDLHLIRRIRNRFAHGFEEIGFHDPKIETWCRSLQHYFFQRYDHAHIDFLLAVLALAQVIDSATIETLSPTAGPDWPDNVAEELERRGNLPLSDSVTD